MEDHTINEMLGARSLRGEVPHVEIKDGDAATPPIRDAGWIVAIVRKHHVLVEHLAGLELPVCRVEPNPDPGDPKINELRVLVPDPSFEESRAMRVVFKPNRCGVGT